MIGINKFYSFSDTFSETPVYLKSKQINWDISLELIVGNYSNVNLPIVAKQTSGKKWTDILCPSIGLYYVSNRFVNLLKENNITGWQTFPLSVFNKQGEKVEGYRGFSVTGKAGKIDYSKSEIVDRQFVPDGPVCKYYKGLSFNESKWDNSDFFILEDTIQTIVTEKVYKIIIENKLTNFELINLVDYESSVN
jgi:hypothetical protein